MMSNAFLPKFAGVTLAAILTLGLGGCATAPSDPAAKAEFEQVNDPLEPLNRAVFAVNMQLDKMFLRPAGIAYRGVLPQPVQTGVNNFLSNLRAPVVFANDVFQGEMDRAGNTAGRFAINTTVGVLGVWDAAAHFGVKGHSEDFGQTFGTWGIGEGFYLVLPLLGPSNPRDGIGLLTEYFVDPFNIWAREHNKDGWMLARSLVTGIDFRARNLKTLDELERTSLDYYAAIRSLYRQRRADEIRNGKSTADQPAPGISTSPEKGKDDKTAEAR
jgi:phospholipid-binding lipoprotein MlaA